MGARTTYKLGEIAECSLGKMLDQKKNKGKPNVYLGNVAVRWGSFNVDSSQIMLFEDDELPKYQALKGDIIMCEGGEPGRCAIWKEDYPICLQKALHRIRVNEKLAYPYYIYYYLTSLVQSGAVEPFFTGSTIKHLPRERLISLEISLPSLEEQKRLADILCALEEKIAINKRINHNLEEQARALYQSWFVDFEPYKNGIFVDSELGPIPYGWEIIQLNQIVEYQKKTVNPQKSPDTWFVHYSLPAFDNSKEPEIQRGSDIMSNKFILEGKTVLFSKLNPRIKRIWLIEETTPNSVCSTEFISYKAKDAAIHPFVWCYLNGDSFYDKVMSEVNGATGSHQRFHADDTLDYLIPFNLDTAISLSEHVAPLLQSIIKNEKENRVLKNKRDTLLPKLMNGELKLTC